MFMEGAMKMKKWIPWNWFKREDGNSGSTVPVRHQSPQEPGPVFRNSLEMAH